MIFTLTATSRIRRGERDETVARHSPLRCFEKTDFGVKKNNRSRRAENGGRVTKSIMFYCG